MSGGKFAPKGPRASVPSRSVAESFVAASSTVKLTLNFDNDLRQRLKMRAVVEERTMREIVEEAVTTYLGDV